MHCYNYHCYALLIGQFPIIIVVSGAVPVLLIVCLFILFPICCVLIVKRRRASNEDELYTNPNSCYCTVNNITRTKFSSRFIFLLVFVICILMIPTDNTMVVPISDNSCYASRFVQFSSGGILINILSF